jgi:hypothetical protein
VGTNQGLDQRIAEARAAHARGWALTPLNGKMPTLDAWQKQPAPTLDQVLAWARKGNLGLRTGAASGVFVVDEDTAKGGDLAAVFPDLPATPTVVTGGGGRHLYFRAPEPCPGNSASKLGPHIDTRGEGGQVVFVGSVHPVTQQVYAWAPGRSPDEVALADLPPEVLQVLVPPPTERRRGPAAPPPGRPTGSRYVDRALEAEISRVAGAPEGQRNATLNEAAFNLFQLVHGGELAEHVARERLVAACHQCGLVEDDGLASVEATIESASRAAARSPRRAPAPAPPPAARRGLHVVGNTARQPDPAPPPQDEPDGLPGVLIPGPHQDDQGEYHEIGSDDFAAAVLDALPPGLLYRRADLLGEIVGEPGKRCFRPLTNNRMRVLVDANIRLIRWVKKRGDDREVAVYQPCTNDQAGILIDSGSVHPAVRDLVALTSYPVFLGADLELAAPGWNPAHGVFYDQPPALARLPEIRDVDQIQAILGDLVVDFPFKNDASRHNFIGLLLTPMLRPAIAGNVPMHLILSSLERTGKTKLAEEVLGGVILGEPSPAMQLATREEEREKRILSILRRGDTVLHLDNIRDFIDSPSLASLLTSTSFSGRVLTVSEIATVKNGLTVVGTGNNVRATGEIVKRTIPIQLQPATDSPEDRTDFKHPDLRGYVAENRAQVLGALIGMVTRWREGTRWLYPRPIGGYERWTALVGGILGYSGFGAWIENYRAWVRASDPWNEDLRAFVREWADELPEGMKSPAADLAKIADEEGLFAPVLQGKSGRAMVTAFSMRVLRKHVDTPVEGWIIRKTGDAAQALYFLERQP